jgi:putative transposase
MRGESTGIPPSKACRRLRRLPKPHYQGRAYVHWSMTTQDRQTGWLTTSFHHHFREVLLHMLVRYSLACPIYCLMPDHLHILLVGISPGSDQLKGVQFFRRNLPGRSPEPFRFQNQAYDSVLREEDRALDAFPAVVAYIADNPVRKELVSARSEYTFSGSLFAGMPDLDWRRKDFWSVFWTAVNS